MLPNAAPGRETKPSVPPSPVGLSPLSPIPHPLPGPSIHPRTTKKSGIGRVWSKLKKFMKKFGGDQPPPKLSDRLVPERADQAKQYESLFPKSPKPTKSRK